MSIEITERMKAEAKAQERSISKVWEIAAREWLARLDQQAASVAATARND